MTPPPRLDAPLVALTAALFVATVIMALLVAVMWVVT